MFSAASACETFSSARRGSFESRLPRALRTVEQPWGKNRETLRDYEFEQLQTANSIVRFVLAFFKKCIQHRVPFIIENPASSLLWLLPEFVALMASTDVCSVVFDMCLFKSLHKKRTRLLGYMVDLPSFFDNKTCPGRKVCSVTGLPHHLLTGAFKGVFRTRAAKEYPPLLCRSLADTFEESFRRSLLNDLWAHVRY